MALFPNTFPSTVRTNTSVCRLFRLVSGQRKICVRLLRRSRLIVKVELSRVLLFIPPRCAVGFLQLHKFRLAFHQVADKFGDI